MQIIGHRGAAGLAPENTPASFRAAMNACAQWIEFDVHATKDGQVVVIHDPTTGRTFAHDYTVASTPLAELRTLGVPTLAEIMELIGNKAKVNIEIKSAGCAPAVVAAVQKAGYSQTAVSSFSKARLREVHKLDPKVRLAFLQSINILGFLTMRPLYAVGFWHFLAPGFVVRLAKKRGLFTYAYTVDDPARARELEKRDFDGVVTNRPDRF